MTQEIESKDDSSRNEEDIRNNDDIGYMTNNTYEQHNQNNSQQRYEGHNSKQRYRKYINDKNHAEDCFNSKEYTDLKTKSKSYKVKIENNSKTSFKDLNVIAYDVIDTSNTNARSQNISITHSAYLPHDYNNSVENENGNNVGYKYNMVQCNDRITNSKNMKLKESRPKSISEKSDYKNIEKCIYDKYYLPIKYRQVDNYTCNNTATYRNNLKGAYSKRHGLEPSNNGSLIDIFYNEKKCTLNNGVNRNEPKSSKQNHVTNISSIDNNNNDLDNYKDHDDSDDYLTADDRSELSNRLQQ